MHTRERSLIAISSKVRARKARRIDLEAVEDCLNRLGRTEAAIPELTRRRELYALESFTSDVKDAKKHSEVIRVARCAAVFGLDEIVEKRVQEEQGRGPRFFEIGGNDQWDSAEKYLRTLEMLRERTKERAFDAAMEIAQFLEVCLFLSCGFGCTDCSSSGDFVVGSHLWHQRLVGFNGYQNYL